MEVCAFSSLASDIKPTINTSDGYSVQSFAIFFFQESSRTVTESATRVMQRVSSVQGHKVRTASAAFLHGELVLTVKK